ncbi:hypothetical protein Tco_0352289 [Tanacetum coccineum]
MSAFNLNKPIYSVSFIIHPKSASGNDALVVFTAEADLGKYAPSDFIPQQQGMNEGTKNTSYDYLFIGTDPHVLADKTHSVSEGLETVLTQPITGKGASFIARQVKEDEAPRIIKLEDLAKLVSSVQLSFKDLDSPEDDPIIVVDDSDEDEESDKVHATTNAETEDASVPKSSSPSSLPIELKELPSKFNELAEEVKGLKKQVHDLEIELPGELKEIPTKLEEFTKTVTSLTSQLAELKTLKWELLAEFLSVPTKVEVIHAKLKTLDALPCLLHKVTNVLNQFAQAIASKKTEDDNVPSAGQAGTQPAEGEKNTNQATISHPQKNSSQPKGEHIKKDKGKKTLSLEEAEKESTDSDSDDETHMIGSMVESSRIKKVKKFNFVTKDGKHIHLNKEQTNQQKKIEEEAKAEAAKRESEVRKEELVNLLGSEVVNKYYNDKLHYDRYCDKMLNKRADQESPTVIEVMNACPNKTRKGWTTIYDQIHTRSDYINATEAELGINLDIPLSEQDPLDKLNDLTNKKRKHADDIHDYFKASKRIKSSVQYEDHLAGTMLNEHVLVMIIRHQGPGLDDHARTFSSLLLAEVDRKPKYPLKQLRNH